jgi:hypothetical protein
MTLFSDQLTNENQQKFQLFAGSVIIGLNVFLSWNQPRLSLGVFEPTAWCVEETLMTIMNRARGADPEDQDWGVEAATVAYNGEFTLAKSRVERGDSFWRQLLAWKFHFLVLQKGPA